MPTAPDPFRDPSPGPQCRTRCAGERPPGSDAQALGAHFQQVYDELKRLARGVRARGGGETLCTTALVHEAYLKLGAAAGLEWRSPAHFLSVAARAMRQVLVDAARYRLREKRGGADAWAVTLEEGLHAAPVRPEELLVLDAALDRLAALDERQARVVEYRFFAGLTAAETASVLEVSEPTVNRDWRAARAWLRREMRDLEAADGR